MSVFMAYGRTYETNGGRFQCIGLVHRILPLERRVACQRNGIVA